MTQITHDGGIIDDVSILVSQFSCIFKVSTIGMHGLLCYGVGLMGDVT